MTPCSDFVDVAALSQEERQEAISRFDFTPRLRWDDEAEAVAGRVSPTVLPAAPDVEACRGRLAELLDRAAWSAALQRKRDVAAPRAQLAEALYEKIVAAPSKGVKGRRRGLAAGPMPSELAAVAWVVDFWTAPEALRQALVDYWCAMGGPTLCLEALAALQADGEDDAALAPTDVNVPFLLALGKQFLETSSAEQSQMQAACDRAGEDAAARAARSRDPLAAQEWRCQAAAWRLACPAARGDELRHLETLAEAGPSFLVSEMLDMVKRLGEDAIPILRKAAWVDARGARVSLASLDAVSFSEGMRMAAAVRFAGGCETVKMTGDVAQAAEQMGRLQVADADDTLRRGGFLPLSATPELERVDAFRYAHRALGGRVVVRLTASRLRALEDARAQRVGMDALPAVEGIASMAPFEETRTRGMGEGTVEACANRMSVSVNEAWRRLDDLEVRAVLHDPALARAAVEAFDGVREAAGLVEKPAKMKQAVEDVVEGAAPVLVPLVYEAAARVFLRHGEAAHAAGLLALARAEDDDVEWACAAFLRLLGDGDAPRRSLVIRHPDKSLTDFGKWLQSKLGTASWPRLRALCSEAVRLGVPPNEAMVIELARLARVARVDWNGSFTELLQAWLPMPSVEKTNIDFWKAALPCLRVLAAGSGTARARLLDFFPSTGRDSYDDTGTESAWMGVLDACGSLGDLTVDTAGPWVTRALTHEYVGYWHAHGAALYAAVRSLSALLRESPSPVSAHDVDVLDLLLEIGAPVEAPAPGKVLLLEEWAKENPHNEECPRALAFLTADPRFEDTLLASIATFGEKPQVGLAIRKTPALQGLMSAVLERDIAAIAGGGVDGNPLARVAAVLPETFASAPRAYEALAALDAAALLARALRTFVPEELAWPALEDAAAGLFEASPQASLLLDEAFPCAVVASERRAMVVGPDGVCVDHWLTQDNPASFNLENGELLCAFRGDTGYWWPSGRRASRQELTAEGNRRRRWRLHEAVPPPAGVRSALRLSLQARSLCGELRVPGDDVPRLVDVHGNVRLGGCTVSPGHVTQLLPVQFWHMMTPRDERGSAALRALSRQEAERLLAAGLSCTSGEEDEASSNARWLYDHHAPRRWRPRAPVEDDLYRRVREILPALTNPLLVRGVQRAVSKAAKIARQLEALRESRRPAGFSTAALADLPPKSDLQQAMLAVGAGGSKVRQAFESADEWNEVVRFFLKRHPSTSNFWMYGLWPLLVGRMAALAFIGASVATPEAEREGVCDLLELWATLPFCTEPASFRHVEMRDGRLPRWELFMRQGDRVVVARQPDLQVCEALEYAPNAAFGDLLALCKAAVVDTTPGLLGWEELVLPPPRLTREERCGGCWETQARLQAYVAHARQAGPVPYERRIGERLAALTGVSYVEAALLWTGLLYIDHWASTPLLHALDVRKKDLEFPRYQTRFKGRDRLRLYAAAMPDEPERLWTPLGQGDDDPDSPVARLARAWHELCV